MNGHVQVSDPLHSGDSPLYALTKVHAVGQLVQAMLYKPEGRDVDSRWGRLDLSLT